MAYIHLLNILYNTVIASCAMIHGPPSGWFSVTGSWLAELCVVVLAQVNSILLCCIINFPFLTLKT